MRYLYFHGFASSPQSGKARFFAGKFQSLGIDLEIPALDAGDFEHLTISGQLEVIEELRRGDPCVAMGSSMGGYLAAITAARHPEVERVFLMAPAFGFASRWPLALGEDRVRDWQQSGWTNFFHYADGAQRRVHWDLLADGRKYEDYPDVRQPALIFHGLQDEVVPAEYSREFAQDRPNVELHLVESGHELSDQVEPMWEALRRFLFGAESTTR